MHVKMFPTKGNATNPIPPMLVATSSFTPQTAPSKYEFGDTTDNVQPLWDDPSDPSGRICVIVTSGRHAGKQGLVNPRWFHQI
jgi:hypothetical protein